eukprot:245539-Alexandrium_andersonii.AAC.1
MEPRPEWPRIGKALKRANRKQNTQTRCSECNTKHVATMHEINGTLAEMHPMHIVATSEARAGKQGQ